MTPADSVSRRSLLAGSGAAVLGLSPLGARAATRPTSRPGKNLPLNRIGATPFSVQDQATALGYAKLFPILAEIGYTCIEFSGFNSNSPVTPKQVAKLLADNGLKGIGNKAAMDQASIDAALGAGLPYTGISQLTDVHGAHTDGWKQTADDLNSFGKKCVKSGLKGFFIHMHGPEYTSVADNPNLQAIDVLLKYTDPRYVFWEMDIYWAYYYDSYLGAGGVVYDPLTHVLAHPERFPFFHVKDGTAAKQPLAGPSAAFYDPNNTVSTFPLADGITDVGQGNIDFKHFFGELAKKSRLENHYYFWERDNASSGPHGSLSSARASYLMMAHNRLADPKAY